MKQSFPFVYSPVRRQMGATASSSYMIEARLVPAVFIPTTTDSPPENLLTGSRTNICLRSIVSTHAAMDGVRYEVDTHGECISI